MANKVRVRYAPSPTGFLHIGGARTALFNYLYAKRHNGDFIVRIEDTDIERNVEGGEASQLDNLRWLGVTPDESIDIGGPYAPYRQMERLDLYTKHAAQLVESGQAYKCFCSTDTLAAVREQQLADGIAAPHYNGACRNLSSEEIKEKEHAGIPYTIRMRVPENHTYRFDDLVRGTVTFESKDIGDWVIVKTNGIPTYNFAVALDDYYMDITHVFRGEEHLSNTPKQMMIFDAWNWEAPQFGHMTLIVNEQRKKLSKRDETIVQFVSQYRELGYLPEAMFNFFALLGWSPEGEQEIFSKDALIASFDINRLSKSVSMFDAKKLKWMNNQYLKALPLQIATTFIVPFLQKAGALPATLTNEEEQWATTLISLYQEQLSYGAEIVPLTAQFFTEDLSYTGEAKTLLQQEHTKQIIDAFIQAITALDSFDAHSIKGAIKTVQQATNLKGKQLFMPIRAVTTGQTSGPELPVVLQLLGKERVLHRLQAIYA
ncbi:MAG: glutamate--tRNA ligase [Solibacillus sp.]